MKTSERTAEKKTNRLKIRERGKSRTLKAHEVKEYKDQGERNQNTVERHER